MSSGKCFVISPIGTPDSDARLHSDAVLEFIIKPATDSLNLKAIRSDHIEESGRITDQMFREILEADVCVAILTFENPNVYYELAVAQCAARPTLLLIEQGCNLPFDVKDLRVIEYDIWPQTIGKYSAQVIAQLRAFAADGWQEEGLFHRFQFGPPIYYEKDVQRLVETAKPEPLGPRLANRYVVPGDSSREIQILTGGIEDVGNVATRIDVVVCPTTLDLRMPDIEHQTMMSMLRYRDATLSKGNHVERDNLQKSLEEELLRGDYQIPVEAGTVVATPTTKLRELDRIQYVFHAATTHGRLAGGYTSVADLGTAVRYAYDRFEELAREVDLKTILWPLFGAGMARRDPDQAARALLAPIVKRMVLCSTCKTTYLLAWKASHLEAFRKVAKEINLEEIPVDA